MENDEDDVKLKKIIPAPPGYSTLDVLDEEDGSYTGFWERKIIAFLIEHYDRGRAQHPLVSVWAITLDGVTSSAILQPDGTVEIQGEEDFPSKEEYLNALNERRAKKP